jgi:hypothetical protein
MRLPGLILLVAAVSAAACGDDTPTAPSTPTTPTTVTERFDAIVNVKGSSFFPFSVGQGGSVSINFASLSPLNRPGLLDVPMEIGYGTTMLDGDNNVVGCDLVELSPLPGIVAPNCNKSEGVVPCNGNPKGGAAQICIAMKKCVAKFCIAAKGQQQGAGQAPAKKYLTFEQLGFAGGVKPSLRAGAGGGTLLTIPGVGGASVEAQLPAAH